MNDRSLLLLNGYDFVDFGCSSGGSMQFAVSKLGGRYGIGLDIDGKKVEKCRRAGFDAAVADVSALDPARIGRVRFAVLSHFLEHLPNVEIAEKCIRSAIAVSDEFVFIRQPYFDADDYLNALGLRLYWSNWHGHRNHMKSADFLRILDCMLTTGDIRRYITFGRTPITGSGDHCVHPVSSPTDQHEWTEGVHAAKPVVSFRAPVFREFGAVIHTRAKKLVEPPRRFLLSCTVLADSAKGLETARENS